MAKPFGVEKYLNATVGMEDSALTCQVARPVLCSLSPYNSPLADPMIAVLSTTTGADASVPSPANDQRTVLLARSTALRVPLPER